MKPKNPDFLSRRSVANVSQHPLGATEVAHRQQDERAEALQTRILELQSSQTSRDTHSLRLQAFTSQLHESAHRLPVVPNPAELPQRDAVPGPSQSLVQRVTTSIPSWLISALFHAMLLIILLFWTERAAQTPLVVILSEATESADLPQPLPRVLIEPPETHIDNVALALETTPTPRASVAPLELQPPEIPRGLAALDLSVEQGGAMLAASSMGKAQREQGQPGAQFFGVQATGNDFVFIVDSSMSMIQKIGDARRELEYAIRKLSPKQRFYVLFFDQNTERMRLGTWDQDHKRFTFHAQPEPDLVPATTPNVDAFVRWMNTIELEFATNPYEATAFAIRVLKPDAIFLLSDGEFTDRGATEWFLLGNNAIVAADGTRQLRTVVHCIGFYSREGEIALKRIAAANGGTYRFVDPPPGYIPLFHAPRGGMRRGVR